jgi:ribose-phosphate pyrophosphokinase
MIPDKLLLQKRRNILSRGAWKNIFDFTERDFPSLKGQPIKLFTGSSNPGLAEEIAEYLDVPIANAVVSRFTNGEIKVKVEESVRGNHVFIIQPTCHPTNDNLMELLIMVDAMSRAAAISITTVIPYFGYAKQEKKTAGREPITAKLVANLIQVAGSCRVVTMDLHAAAIQGFFDIPVDNLYAFPIFEYYFKQHGLIGDDIVIVAPDAGGVARAQEFAERLNASMAIIFKRRPRPDVAEIVEIVGDVKGKRAIIIDDMISTGGTLVLGAKAIMDKGAQEIYACATHGVFAGNAVELLNDSPIHEIITTNTIPMSPDDNLDKFTRLSVAPMFAETIRRNYFNLSVSRLYV